MNEKFKKAWEKVIRAFKKNRLQSFIILITCLFLIGGIFGNVIQKKDENTRTKTTEDFGSEINMSYNIASDNVKSAGESAPMSQNMAKRAVETEKNVAATGNTPDIDSEFRKLTKTGFMDIKTDNIETFENELNEIVKTEKGYIYNISQNETDKRRNLNAVIKVPSENFDNTVSLLKTKGKIINTDFSVNDITMQYSQTENRIKTLKIKEERLNAILMKAEKIEDILAVETQLQQTREEIMTSDDTMEILKNQVQYATINISAYDEKAIIQETPHKENFIISIFKNAFKFWSDIFETAVSFIVYSIPLIVFLILFIFLRKRMKIRSEKNQGVIFRTEDIKDNNKE